VKAMTPAVAGRSAGGAVPPVPSPGGQPAAQPDRDRAYGRLRQFGWASVPIWSLSLLAFAPFLRIAFARRRTRDWVVFAGYLAAVILTVVLMSIAGPDDAVTVAAGGLAILVMGVASVHAFVAFRPSQEEGSNGTRASELALATARARMHHRQQARELAAANPVLAAELKIGRPDLPHDYDDGGLVDVNHVPADVLASCLGLTPAESQGVVAARDQISRFSSPEELSAYTDLPPDRVEALRDWILFG
jgi:hypothetical protein